MQTISQFRALAERFDVLYLDLWGVVHDGTALYDGARECLEQLQHSGKKVLLISNAPRRASKAKAVLDQLGVLPSYYHTIITSGEAAYEAFAAHSVPGVAQRARYFYIGPGRDIDLLEGLDYSVTESLSSAQFLLNVGFGSESYDSGEHAEILRQAAAQRLPMVCVNPDLVVQKMTGERFACAGAIALEYIEFGGEVTYFGKPYPQVYALARHLGNISPAERILAVGDGLHTDIAGANAQGVESVLITGGILRGQLPAQFLPQEVPTYVMDSWRW